MGGYCKIQMLTTYQYEGDNLCNQINHERSHCYDMEIAHQPRGDDDDQGYLQRPQLFQTYGKLLRNPLGRSFQMSYHLGILGT